MTFETPAPTPDEFASPNASARGPDPYLRTRVMTATPEQLQLLLFDGAIRFAEQGKVALEDKAFDRSYDRLSRAQRIVSELQLALRPGHGEEVCRRLRALYTFVYLRLVDANVRHEPEAVDDALQILRFQRETWTLLMKQRCGESAGVAGRVDNTPRLSLAG